MPIATSLEITESTEQWIQRFFRCFEYVLFSMALRLSWESNVINFNSDIRIGSKGIRLVLKKESL